MITVWITLAFVSAQTPAPVKPTRPSTNPANAIFKSDRISEEIQWNALACTARLTSSSGELGTAVVVGIRENAVYLLTANHVVSGNADRKLEFFAKETYDKPRELKITESPVFRSALTDLALVKVQVSDTTPYEKKVMKMLQPWKRQNKFPFAAFSVGCTDGNKPTCRVEEIRAKVLVRRANDGGTFFWQTTAPPIQGRSGGPIVDKDGYLLGICTAAQDLMGYYSHLDEIHVALKENGFSWIWETK